MARLWTAGAEVQDTGAVANVNQIEGYKSGTGTLTFDTGTVRSGARSFKVDAGAGNATIVTSFDVSTVNGRNYYQRSYINIPAAPTADSTIMLSLNSGGEVMGVRLTTSLTLLLRAGGVQVGSASPALSTGQWYRVELRSKIGTGATDECELLLDGVSIASTAVANVSDTALSIFRFGWGQAPGANKALYFDDVALNDDQGANQNSWPGDGNVVLLLPTADSAVGAGWTLGSGGTPLFGGVDNTPPAGVADTGTTAQIRNATSNANSAYDATMTTYTAAGVPAGATVNVVDPIVATAAPVSTGAKQGTVGLASNPAITPVALAAAGVSGAFWQGNAAGTYPTGWKISHGTVTYAPAVTLGTAPVMRINQVTSSTRIAMACFMGIYVDYTPAQPVPIFVTPRSGRT